MHAGAPPSSAQVPGAWYSRSEAPTHSTGGVEHGFGTHGFGTTVIVPALAIW